MTRLSLCLVVASALLFSTQVQAITPGSIDPAFRSGLNRVGAVRSLARQPDGKILIAGRFETVQGRLSSGIARLLPNGQIDPTFQPGLALRGGAAYQVGVQPDGKILVVGDFSGFHLSESEHIVRLLPNGTLDPTFFCNPSDEVTAFLLQPDGRIVIAGDFDRVNGVGRSRIARLNANGSLDTSFDPGSGIFGGPVSALAQAGEQCYVTGFFATYNGIVRSGIARINADGSLDSSFDPGTGASGIQSIAIDALSRPVIVGTFSTYNGGSSQGIARINLDGSRDTTFAIGSGTQGFISQVRILPTGAILIAGAIQDFDGTPRRLAARLRPDGALDTAFNLGSTADGTIYDILPNGSNFLLGGAFSFTEVPPFSMCAQVTSAGRPSPSFRAGVTGDYHIVDVVAAQPDGKALIAGSFQAYGGAPRAGLARILANGRVDPSFNPRGGADDRIFDCATQPDGRIVVVGAFTTFDSVPRPGIARLLPDGRLDPTFAPTTGPNNVIFGVALSPTGEIYVGGSFTEWGTATRRRLARLTAAGELDLSYAPDGVEAPLFAYVRALAVNPVDGSLTLGGAFTTCNGVPRSCIARLTANGALDTSFDPGSGTDGPVQTLALLGRSGSVVLGGDFSTYNGTSRSHIAIASPDGSLNVGFNPGSGFDNQVYDLDVQLNERIVVVGEFTSYDGREAPGIIRLESNGLPDRLFNVGSGPSETPVNAVAVLPSGRILAVGGFSSFNGRPHANVVSLLGAVEAAGARFSGTLQPDINVEVAGTVSLNFTEANVFSAVVRQRNFTTTFRGTFNSDGDWTGVGRRSDGVEVAAELELSYTTVGVTELTLEGTYLCPEGRGELFAIRPFQAPSPRAFAGTAGYYTASLNLFVGPDPDVPNGAGILTLTQGASGPARLTGTTADGRPFTAAASLSSNGLLFLHTNLPGGAGGFLNGVLLVDFGIPAREVSGVLVWHRRPGPAPYANGFTRTIGCNGSLYVRPDRLFLDLAPGPDNGRLSLEFGHLPGPLSRLVTVSTASRVTPSVLGSVSGLTLNVNPRTGLFSGSFLPPGNTRTATLRGIATTVPKVGFGYSLFLGSGDTPPQRSSLVILSTP